MTSRSKSIVVALALALITALVYSPVARHQFINYDDPDYIIENHHIQTGLNADSIAWAFSTGYAGNWHPLTWVSHMVDFSFFGLNARGHHVTNLVLHSVNTALLFLAFSWITGACWRSAFVAALFGLHPIHVESVAWASERKDVLSGLFFILTVWTYAKYARDLQKGAGKTAAVKAAAPKGTLSKADSRPMPVFFYCLSLVLFALGLMSKPMLVTLPFVLLLLDWWPLARLGHDRPSPIRRLALPLLVEKIPFFALSAASSIVTFAVQHRTGTVAALNTLSPATRVENGFIAYLLYVFKLVWPVNLAPFYPYETDPQVGLAVLGALLVLGGVGCCIRMAGRIPYLLTGWLWFVGTLVPVIGIVQVGSQSMADRYTYIPSIGLFIILSWGAAELANAVASTRAFMVWIGSGSVFCCAVLAARQVQFWNDSESLFRHAIQVTRDNYLAEHNLGAILIEKNQLDEAASHFAESVRIKPGYAQGQSDLGLALAFKGKFAEAVDHYQKAIAARPELDKPHYNLGSALRALGKKKEAAAEFEEALRLNPAFFEARSALATLLAEEGNFEESFGQFSVLLGEKPNDADLHREFGRLLQGHGKPNEASQQFAEVLRLRPNDPVAHQELGLALADSGQLTESVSHLAEAVRLQPSPGGYYQLALVFDMQGKRQEAAHSYHKALELHPDWPPALNDLAWLLATAPEPQLRNGQEAVRLASKACELSKNREARFLGTLDAAYAEAGDFKRAMETAKRAATLAIETGQKEVADAASKRLEFYKKSEPYHQH